MRKVLAAGAVGFGLLAGCVASQSDTNRMYKQVQAATDRKKTLAFYTSKCIRDYGYSPKTAELSKCVQSLDEAAVRKKQDDMKALGDAFSGAIEALNPTICNTSGYRSGGTYNSTTTCR